MRKFYLPFTLVVSLLAVVCSNAQDFSNKGRDFWLCFPSHVPSGNSLAEMYIYITSDANSSGVITYNGQTQNFTVTANTVTTVPIIRAAAYISDAESNTPVNKGIEVKVNPGQPSVVVYTEIYASARTEATLVLPVTVLNRKYRAISYYQYSTGQSKSQFEIIAVEANTSVQVQLMKNGIISGAPFTIVLPNIGDVYQIQDALDLSGSLIESVSSAGEPCKRIAVFSGSSAVGINSPSCVGNSFDPLFQQCYPITSWGKNFGVVPIAGNPAGYQARAMASEDNTTVNYNGNTIVLNAGQVYPAIASNVAPQTQPIFITADKPICVAEYLLSENCAGFNVIGDPDMIILNPIEQNISNITIFTSTHQAISNQYLNVLIPTAAAASFKVNGAAIGGFLPMPTDPQFSYRQYLFPYGDNSYTLSADSGFNAICYGLGSVETYGYSAGTNVLDLYQFIQISNPYATVNFPASCKGQPFYFSIVFPYQPTQIDWNFFGLFPNVTQTNPLYDSTWFVNGRQLYRYKLPTPYTIYLAGTYPIQVIAQNPTADGCSGQQQIDYNLQVFSPPVSNFTFTSSGCLSDSVHFFGTPTNLNGRPVINNSWAFGDGGTAAIQNPAHKYNAAGSYIVKYSVITDIGCLSDTSQQTVSVSPPPIAAFSVSQPQCIGQAVNFIDQSNAAGGVITHWFWNFGEGPTVDATNGNPQTHIYNSSGQYTVTLYVQTTGGCQSMLYSQVITINEKPVANFNFTGACLPSGSTQFTDQSTISSGNIAQWSWNFGDGGTSAQQNPVHNYASTGPFNVKLTVTSANGCTDSVLKIMNIVYAQPQASFNGPAEVCRGSAANFTDQSTAPNSTITQWSWNFGDGGTSTQQNPSYTYTSPGTYTVILNTVSAAGCPSTTATKTIIVNPLPTTNFTISAPGCINQLISFTDISVANAGNIVSWSWTFGDGGTSALQNPQHTYTNPNTYSTTLQVTTNKGCINTATKQLAINPLPVANFGASQTCVLDPVTQFTDSSTISDGTQNLFTYSWNFGDPNATPGNPNTSTLKNPQHKYTVAGPYTITLTVISGGGCSTSVTKPFFVNGGLPIPSYTLQGSTSFCSGNSISLVDNSTVTPGNVVKIEVYWDYTTDPGIKTIDNTPLSGNTYTHLYPEFGSPASRTVTIRYVAYSGQSCVQYIDRTITLLATPTLQFDILAGVCKDVPAFQITQASITNGLPGTGTFSGPGVSTTGFFDPNVSGAGTKTIRYTYAAANGCSNYKEQTIDVFALPVVNAGPDRGMLQYGSTVLLGSATGNGLTYLWTPNVAINNPALAKPTVSPPTDQLYTLSVTTSDGCTASDEVMVNILKAPVIPNIFSPNGDGVHDKWDIPYLSTYVGCTVDIYNRYGQLIYHSIGYDNAWDGTVNGKQVPVGTYYYVIDPKNGRSRISGYVDVIR